jgi:hypothetical protein
MHRYTRRPKNPRRDKFRALALLAGSLASAAFAALALAGMDSMPGMKMDSMPGMKMEPTEGGSAPVTQAFTTNHLYRVDLVRVPRPIPFEKYFGLQLAVYDGKNPARRITDASVEVSAGMRHGRAHGFAHGMQSTPVVEMRQGAFVVRGMFFHMAGPWVLEVHVRQGASSGTAYLRLVCCGK